MRIAYFAHLNKGRGSGVVAKVVAQLDTWRREGHTVRIFVATRDDDRSWAEALGAATVRRYAGPASRLGTMTRLVGDIRSFRPHLIYARWDLFYPPMLWLPGSAPLVAEVNTDDLAENALGTRGRAWYNRLTRGYWLRRSAALVFVTPELGELPAFRRTRARRAAITNGISLTTYPVLSGPTSGPLRIVFAGTGNAPWHGVDKLVRLAAHRPEWQVDVIGVPRLSGGTPNVTWHPPLDRDRLLEVLAGADVGVGSLAMHRNALDEGCPLKTREYLAVGLPVLYGYRDPDADRLGRLVLRIANTETNVDDEIDRIDAFMATVRGLRVPRAEIAHLDTSEKEGQRLALFAAVARD